MVRTGAPKITETLPAGKAGDKRLTELEGVKYQVLNLAYALLDENEAIRDTLDVEENTSRNKVSTALDTVWKNEEKKSALLAEIRRIHADTPIVFERKPLSKDNEDASSGESSSASASPNILKPSKKDQQQQDEDLSQENEELKEIIQEKEQLKHENEQLKHEIALLSVKVESLNFAISHLVPEKIVKAWKKELAKKEETKEAAKEETKEAAKPDSTPAAATHVAPADGANGEDQ